MAHHEPQSLPIAVRVFPDGAGEKAAGRSRRFGPRSEGMLVIDTETRTDASQKLTFGSSRLIVSGRCLEEVVFYADDLPEQDLRTLERYAATHRADTDHEGTKQIRLMPLCEFVKYFFNIAYKARFYVVGFNLSFDLPRLAVGSSAARGRFAGGFSLNLWLYKDRKGRQRPNPYRPRIRIKHIDSKRALIDFAARNSPDIVDLIPEDSANGKPEKGYKFRGHFLDLKTLTFALTDKAHSLESACEAFSVEHGKQHPSHHGGVTEEYINYNRRDVLATSELAVKLLQEADRHPIARQATQLRSPASLGKGYLRAMGIKPILERQPTFPKEYLGYAQSAFFGARTSVHIRKVLCPTVYTDFFSMYATVNGTKNLWCFVIARKIEVVEHCQVEIEAFLRGLTPDDPFKPETWKKMTGFVKVIPNGDILPTRSKYGEASNDWQVGINHLYAEKEDALWFSIPDVVVSVLQTGRIPKIIDAFRIVPCGIQPGLKPIKLRGKVYIDPRKQDFFKAVVEERHLLALDSDLPNLEKKRLEKSLKVLANATSYGIYAEMNRKDEDTAVNVTCHGIDADPFKCRVAHPDAPGEYWFPPLASLITGGARLMLALLEQCVSERGGTYVMEDTDSMAIVATERGGLVRCPGGPFKMKDGHDAVKALSWAEVQKISQRFAPLSPYGAKPQSILKIEQDNYNPMTGRQRQIYCFAISAKRPALFLLDENGAPVLLQKGVNNHEDRWSEHGLGHLRNPSDLENENRDWIPQVWMGILRRALGLPTKRLNFEHLPAIGRVTISSPAVMRSSAKLNVGKKYDAQLKPFNFLLTCHVKQFGHPIGVDPERFHLIAPYEIDPSRWPEMSWIDQYTGMHYQITTEGFHGNRLAARVKTYGDVIHEYEFHPGSKSADVNGKPCGKQTVGLLQRRHVRVERIIYIGKESNSLEEVGSGTIHAAQSVYTEYPDPRRDEWQTKILPTLKKLPVSALRLLSHRSRSMLYRARAGRSRPRIKNQKLLASILRRLEIA